jgi:hypothetical protein
MVIGGRGCKSSLLCLETSPNHNGRLLYQAFCSPRIHRNSAQATRLSSVRRLFVLQEPRNVVVEVVQSHEEGQIRTARTFLSTIPRGKPEELSEQSRLVVLCCSPYSIWAARRELTDRVSPIISALSHDMEMGAKSSSWPLHGRLLSDSSATGASALLFWSVPNGRRLRWIGKTHRGNKTSPGLLCL